jgi:hypothetical protein
MVVDDAAEDERHAVLERVRVDAEPDPEVSQRTPPDGVAGRRML